MSPEKKQVVDVLTMLFKADYDELVKREKIPGIIYKAEVTIEYAGVTIAVDDMFKLAKYLGWNNEG